ncbi:MAG: hypothetical protein JWM34_467 [Ilumatobacteraceae bacterium]|nr:hypothetical protein [Ilumatobacteraceae bacterium]
MSELVYINVLLDDGAAHPAIVRALFCAVLWHVIMLSATGMVRGLVMEADHSGVDRTLRHRPEVATLREYPFFHVLRASDFAAIDHMFCDRLKSGHAISAH